MLADGYRTYELSRRVGLQYIFPKIHEEEEESLIVTESASDMDWRTFSSSSSILETMQWPRREISVQFQ